MHTTGHLVRMLLDDELLTPNLLQAAASRLIELDAMLRVIHAHTTDAWAKNQIENAL